MLKQRIITALILAPAAICAIFYLPLVYFAGLLLAVVAIGAWEWGPMMGLTTKLSRLSYVISTTLLISVLWYYLPPEQLWSSTIGLKQGVLSLLWLSVIWWGTAALLIFFYPKSNGLWAKSPIVIAILGWLILVPTWLAFMVLRASDYLINDFHGAQLLMVLFLLVWSADIGAYFVGKSIGKNKLMPNVSPGKTIEGFLGGVVCAVILTIAIGFYLNWSSDKMLIALFVAALIATISVLGDLTESMFKRQAGIKDSGSILPGHGGILDRIDSLTATAPIFALCYVLLGW